MFKLKIRLKIWKQRINNKCLLKWLYIIKNRSLKLIKKIRFKFIRKYLKRFIKLLINRIAIDT